MRSGNGRHRRPRQAPALFVTAGVTGAGIAMPLLGATGAQAAEGSTWDRVAECESGGMWSANEGNGYYGGLQLTMETWQEYGGTDLAARPDLASRGQQIDVAEEILEKEGPEAWPSCGLTSGLLLDPPESSKNGQTPTDDPTYEPGPAPAPEDSTEPDDAPGPPAGSDAPEPAPSTPDSRPGEAGTDEDSSVPPSPDASEDSGGDGGGEDGAGPAPDGGESTGRHRGEPDEQERADDGRSSRAEKGRKDAGDGGGDHRVRPGDSLSAIAAEHELDGGWTALYEANREVVGSDPDLILPGQRLEW